MSVHASQISHGEHAEDVEQRRDGVLAISAYKQHTKDYTQLPLGLQLTYATGVHTLSHLRANAGPPTPAAVRRGEVGSTRWAALAHDVRRSAAVDLAAVGVVLG